MLELTLICEEHCAALTITKFLMCGLHRDWNGSSRTSEIALLPLERLQGREYTCIIGSKVSIAES
eukprot:10607462-Ditylum_brightwellii.AAC.1